MTFTTYTRDELRDIIISHIRGRVRGANVAPHADLWHTATALATVMHGDQAASRFLAEQLLPSTTGRRFLDLHATLRSLARLRPAAAAGTAVVREDGGSLVSVPAGSVLSHASGRKYTTSATVITATAAWSGKSVAPGTSRSRIIVKPNASGIAVDDVFECDGTLCAVKAIAPGTGTPLAVDLYVPLPAVPATGAALTPIEGAVVALDADEAGADGNLEPGEELTFDSPIAGLSATAVVLGLSGGGDLEIDEELRARILELLARRDGAGNVEDFRQWARETPDVELADAFVYPGFRGPGTIDVVPFGTSGARVTGAAANAAIAAQLAARAPFSDDVEVVQLTEPTAVDVTIEITPRPGYEADWQGSYSAVLAGSTALQIQLNAAPDALELGDRVLLKTSTVLPRLWERTVVGKLTGPDRIVLDEELPEDVTDGSTVLPGGPLAQPIIDAVAAAFDDLGPGDTDPTTRHPTLSEAHASALRPSDLLDALADIEGVLNASISAPASEQSPAEQQRLKLGSFTIDLQA